MSNRNSLFKISALLVLLTVLVSACNFPGFSGQEDEETANLHITETSIAQTLEAMEPATAEPDDANTPTSTATIPASTLPPGQTATATATGTPIPTLTQPAPPTSSQPTIKADIDTNCRMGPSKLYPVMGYLLVGQQSTVHGRNNDPNKPWWFIENPKKPGTYCWVWGETTRVEGNTSLLPIITPPPPPSPTPTTAPELQVFYSNIHNCAGVPTATFQVVNNSKGELRSTVMTLTDQDTSLTLYGPDISNSPFMAAANNCPPGGNNLTAGSVGYIGGPMGLAIAGHTVRADIQLCTEPGQGGICTVFVIDFIIP